MNLPITAENKLHKRFSGKVWIVSMLILFAGSGLFASDMYLPSLPAIAHHFQASSALVQLSIAIYFISFAFGQMIYGPLSDRYGRRQVIMLGTFICAIGSALCFIAPSFFTFMLGRVVQGAGAAALLCMSRCIVRDTFTDKNLARILSLISLAFTFIPAFAPVIGGHLQHWFGWHSVFVFLIVLYTVVMLIINFLLPETNNNLRSNATEFKQLIKNYRRVISNQQFLSFALMSTGSFAGGMAFWTTAPFLMQSSIGLTPVQYGWLAIIVLAGSVLGRLLSFLYSKRFESRSLIRAGLFFQSVTALSMIAFFELGYVDVTAIMIPMFMFAIGAGLIVPNAAAGTFLPFRKSNIAGSVTSLYGALQLSGGFIGSAIAAHLNHSNQFALGVLLLGINVILWAVLLSYRSDSCKPPRKGA